MFGFKEIYPMIWLSRVMTLLALCFANFMIGTGIDESEVRGVYKDIISSCRQLTCASSLLSLTAWKVILDIY